MSPSFNIHAGQLVKERYKYVSYNDSAHIWAIADVPKAQYVPSQTEISFDAEIVEDAVVVSAPAAQWRDSGPPRLNISLDSARDSSHLEYQISVPMPELLTWAVGYPALISLTVTVVSGHYTPLFDVNQWALTIDVGSVLASPVLLAARHATVNGALGRYMLSVAGVLRNIPPLTITAHFSHHLTRVNPGDEFLINAEAHALPYQVRMLRSGDITPEDDPPIDPRISLAHDG